MTVQNIGLQIYRVQLDDKSLLKIDAKSSIAISMHSHHNHIAVSYLPSQHELRNLSTDMTLIS